MSAESYLSRGVSPTKDEVKAAVKNQDKGVFPGQERAGAQGVHRCAGADHGL